MSEFAFGLKSPTNLVEKLGREINRLKAAELPNSDDKQNRADHAVNCALTAWHISDWVFAAGLTTNSVNAKTLGNFQKQLCDDCQELRVCKDLANGSKHFKLTKPENSTVSKTTDRKSIGGGLTRSLVQPLVRPVVSSLTGGYTVFVLEVTMRDGSRVRAQNLFESALFYWRNFIESAQMHRTG